MTRRVAAGLIGLVVAVVALVAIPLGLRTVSRENAVFRSQAQERARSLADIVEEQLGNDRPAGITLARYLTPGDQVSVVSSTGHVVAQLGDHPPVDRSMTAQAAQGRATTTRRGDHLLAAVRIGDAAEQDGALLLERPTQALDASVRSVWLDVVATSLLALVAALAMSWQIARWVSRPLRRLEDAAAAFGEGHLDARAGAIAGPPEVQDLARSFDRMGARLETLVHGHRGMLADVSHQLRTPLAALRLRLELMTVSDTDTTELTGALGEVTRLSRLVDGLLAVARAEGSVEAVTAVDLEQLLVGRVSAWQPVAAERGVTLEQTVLGHPVASATAGHLEQVLDNLIDNALEALAGGGHIRLLAGSDDAAVQLEVVDDGPGIPAELCERALRRFSTGRTDGGGAGLGLAIVHRLVTVNGGDVQLEESAGGGLTVRITLPTARDRPASLYRF